MKAGHFCFALIIFAVALFPLYGCSNGGGDVGMPPIDKQRDVSLTAGSHVNWGLWQFIADPDKGALEIIRLREGNMHLNALIFLEPPPLVNLTLESLEFNGDIIEADIGLKHPFLGLNEFTGFDVCGVLITNGSYTGFTDPDIRMAGDGDTYLLNPDGYARWWNPTEFPVNTGTMLGYNDGLLGTTYEVGNYNSTVNGYKYFCDDLDADSPLSDVNLHERGHFSAGQKNIRHYTIELGTEGLVFNYAVDASWKFPTGGKPYNVPDDFAPGANRAEAWRVVVTETKNTLYNDGETSGGELHLDIDVYDWFNVELNTVRVESPGNFDMVESSTPVEVNEGYAIYGIQVNNTNPIPQRISLLISVISEEEKFEGFIGGVNTTAYFTHEADVSDESPTTPMKNIPLRDDEVAKDLAVTPQGDLLILYDDAQVWKYYPTSDFQQESAQYIFTAQVVPWVTTGQLCNNRIDVSSTGDIFASAAQGTGFGMDSWPAQCFNSTGTPIGDAPAPGTGGPCPDVYIYPPGGFYSNNHMVIAPNSSGNQNNMYRHVNVDYWAQIYQTSGENAATGYDKVKLINVVGAEGVSGNQFWLLEDTPDYYAARWMHTGASWGYFNFDNAWFGTGTQTADDTGWYEAKDITMDSSGRFYILDKLSSGQGRIKLFESGSPGTALTDNAAGDADSISETPLRIEGGDYDSGDYGNLIFALHGDGIPSKLSVFLPEDFGF